MPCWERCTKKLKFSKRPFKNIFTHVIDEKFRGEAGTLSSCFQVCPPPNCPVGPSTHRPCLPLSEFQAVLRTRTPCIEKLWAEGAQLTEGKIGGEGECLGEQAGWGLGNKKLKSADWGGQQRGAPEQEVSSKVSTPEPQCRPLAVLADKQRVTADRAS